LGCVRCNCRCRSGWFRDGSRDETGSYAAKPGPVLLCSGARHLECPRRKWQSCRKRCSNADVSIRAHGEWCGCPDLSAGLRHCSATPNRDHSASPMTELKCPLCNDSGRVRESHTGTSVVARFGTRFSRACGKICGSATSTVNWFYGRRLSAVAQLDKHPYWNADYNI
jgi:hypothetical protein